MVPATCGQLSAVSDQLPLPSRTRRRKGTPRRKGFLPSRVVAALCTALGSEVGTSRRDSLPWQRATPARAEEYALLVPRHPEAEGERSHNPSLRVPQGRSKPLHRAPAVGASATGPAGPRGSGFVASLLPTHMKRASTSIDMVAAAESSYQQTLADAIGSGLGGDPGLAFVVRAAGGGTGIGRREHDDPDPAPRHPSPAACSPRPAARHPASGGRRRGGGGRGAGPGSGACMPLSGRLGRGACWLMSTG